MTLSWSYCENLPHEVSLLLWFYLTGLILLIGAEINATLEQAAAQGKDRGARGYPDSRAK